MQITRRRSAIGTTASATTATLTRPALADTADRQRLSRATWTGPSSAPGVGDNRGVIYAVETPAG